ncbi:fatty acid synthase [Dacryopinax primogenitus]|uniref:Fatty acid synthase subunit alpha n=1 Tax=Dacryopinax primogenitus (strain DJM 731) TaxID=1858805 RepID=M5GE25_DACPD|nr:fatty acid synthase [Dacryopinax primogenitus]EJU05022.1 fatty acid synthase [Dacryopinax primogenitus]
MSPPNGNPVHGDEERIALRPLVLQSGPLRISIPVSATNNDWLVASVLREEFQASYQASEQVAEESEPPSAQPEVELVAQFLAFVANRADDGKFFTLSRVCVLLSAAKHFTSAYLGATDIHSLTAEYDPDTRASVLTAYYTGIAALERALPAEQVPRGPKSTLFEAAKKGEAQIYGLFGGQGTNEVYFDELQQLFEIYGAYVRDFISTATYEVLVPLAAKAQEQGHAYYNHGLDVLAWLTGTTPRPPVAYLASVPISFLLIGLTQLVQYLISCRVLGLHPGEMRSLIKGATGHSQGVVSAVCIAASTSYESYNINVAKSLRWLFACGLRGQEAFPTLTVEPSLVADCIQGGEGTPSPMLAVTGLELSKLRPHIEKTNKHLPENSQLIVSLNNGRKAFVITGPPRALCGLVNHLRKVRAPSGLDQSKIPFSQRKPVFSVRFLVVGVPYHSKYVIAGVDKVIEQDLDGEELWKAEELGTAVYNTFDGTDMRDLKTSVTRSLCDQIFPDPIFWEKACDFPSTATHAIDFGPGGLSGIGSLTQRNLEGRGVRVVVVGNKAMGAAELYSSESLRTAEKWEKAFTPKLVKTLDGRIQIDTPFSRLLGKPPIMVAGMTPTTVKAGFVSAILRAGYHVELAGGGHYNPAALRAKVAEIQAQIPAGVGLTLNALYINQRQFGFQFPLWQDMRREGVPVEGFCVAAGIPSTEKAAEIIGALKAAGIRHIAFKPGSVDGIRQVVNIATANPDFPVIMQWTGGRAGGHHSCEDFHQPILSTYGIIRQQKNIAVVAGSGFGSAEEVWPYITGDWSKDMFGVERMPFDGVLFASWVMTAKEAHTSESVKQLIVKAPGVSDGQWEGTYKKETGGILTVKSELGEPIHKIATRAIKLWKEYDESVFALPKEKRIQWLAQNKDKVIARLNADFQKPWFPSKADGSVVGDIGDMTYEEVVRRMVKLMFVAHQKRWVDISLRNLVGDWLRRIEERFAGVNGHGPKASVLQSFTSLDDPELFLTKFFETYPASKEQLVASEDKAYFLAISQRAGQKPVPFIPVLDASFEVWFKKDSLWQAEDIDAVVDQDPQRVCILQGPVAAKYAKQANVSIKEMLGGVESALISKLLERYYAGDESKVPSIDYIGAPPAAHDAKLPSQYGIAVSQEGEKTTYSVGKTLPPVAKWLDFLAGSDVSWFSALLRSITIAQDKGFIDNPLRRLFVPRPEQRIEVIRKDGAISSVLLYGSIRSFGPMPHSFKAVEVTYDQTRKVISVIINELRGSVSIPLTLQLNYRPGMGYCPIHEVMEKRNWRIKEFYWRLWFGDNESLPTIGLRDVLTGPDVKIQADTVERFCAVIGNQTESFKRVRNSEMQAPMDFAIVTGWQALMKAIFPPSIDGDLLRLVHLSNGFRQVEGAGPLKVGDVCSSKVSIVSVNNTDSGKSVTVKGHLLRDGQPIMEVTSAFLYRGRFVDFENTFEKTVEPQFEVELTTAAQVGVLLSKEWFQWDDDTAPLQPGTTLVFKTESEVFYKEKASFSGVHVVGAAYIRNQIRGLVQVATIDYESGPTQGNPVTAYLHRHGKQLGTEVMFENGGYAVTSAESPSLFTAPFTNEPYSKVSGDFNPIHINPYFSCYASLPGTITHGMWSSAATRKYVESVAAQGHPERVLSYNVNFVGMVLPGDELNVKLIHVGMKGGNMLIKVLTTNANGDKIIEGMAEVAQPPTAYVFTGQGSQEQNMGVELYNSSPAARAVWDAADAHLTHVYGFSIIDIVRNNPKSKTIHFGGIKGQAIRQRYIQMTYDTMDKDGHVKTLPLFPEITDRSLEFSFSSPNGLLFATQFAQIALVVTEKAAFEDMKSKGLVQMGCPFAGHSLGEYSALASIAGVLPISALTDVVFFRGLTMQRAVERDAHDRSNYAMCAVNPGRVSKTFNDAALREVVDVIGHRTELLLEIVNFNVEGQQYVCAGELVSLQTLTNVLNYLKTENIDIPKLTEKFSVEKVKEMLDDIVDECFKMAKALKEKEGHIKLERGFATIPLPGIDVPFHSRYLWAGVMPFRAYLSKKINPTQLDPDMLIGRYIPNLMAQPFEVTREYIQKVYDQTLSPKLDKVLRHWDEENWSLPENRQKLAYTILVELLAYQFASPVRWIETQDLIFARYKSERFIEIGPSPTLTGMASRTLKAKYETHDDSIGRSRVILCASKNIKEIYYQFEDEVTEEAKPTTSEGPAPTAATAVAAPAPVATPVAAAPPAGGAADVPDEPLKAIDTLRIVVAQKLKKKTEEIPLSKTIKDLVGGKSTLQNEILGDLQLEFGSAPEKGEEMPLEELGGALNVGYSGALGKYTSGLVARMVGAKMPGGFNATAIKGYLSKSWGLGPARSDAVLLLGVSMEPPKRLASEAEAKTWLDTVVTSYAKQAGINMSSGGAGAAGGAAAGGAVINSEEFLKFQAQQHAFAEQNIQLYMRYLGKDSRAGARLYDQEKQSSALLQAKLDAIDKEHGDAYIQGIQPVFEPLKARHFDSSWNWVRQDALVMFYDIIYGRLTTVDREITAKCIAIMNRADPALLRYMQYRIDQVDATKGETYRLAKEFGQQLLDNCKEVVTEPPRYKDVTFPTAPHTDVTAKGDIVYSEINRPNVRKLEAYVQEMASGGPGIPKNVNYQKVHDDVTKLWNFVKSQPEIGQEQKQTIKNLHDEVVRSLRKTPAETRLRPSGQRTRRSSSQFLRPKLSSPITTLAEDRVPLLHLKRKVGPNWQYSSNLTSVYMDVLTEIATSGTTFREKNALLTGVGKGSIGVEILKGLLSGGAHVVITTSRFSRSTVEYYQDIYQKVGSRGSALTVVPFNQGSRQDVEALVDYIFTTLGMDLDYIVPFAALPENGREIDGIDDKSELAHRIMLVNVLRLMGAVKIKKAVRHFVTRPTQVVLPLSPNHGLFGNDGLYSESKIALETLFNRWNAESWGEYLCLAGAVIGWTRGTGLMNANNLVAHKIEEHGVRTFSAKEMAFNILGLMHPILFGITQVEPIWADLNGGMDRLPDIADITMRIRSELNAESELRKAVNRDTSADFKVVHGVEAERLHQTVSVTPRANFKFKMPKLESPDAFANLADLRGMVDLDKVIVITGFAEVGPWGSSRTRWEMEARGRFTIEGCIEMAWMMGYVKHFDGRLKNGQLYVGWVDAKTEESVDDKDIRGNYEKDILTHAGIRLIEPELFKGYDPKKKIAYQEIQLNYDLEPLEVAEADAAKFKHEHGDNCDIWEADGAWFVKVKKGARILIPKAFHFDRLVAGQIPTGWDAGRYGIPPDIVAQTDRTALWALACTAEALTMSGFTDPYELYKYVHPSQVGTSLGSGMGGVESMAAMFKDRKEEKDVQKDILQETFINSVAGWVNLLLLSSSGPVKIPVGACATALQSLEIACDSILSGKAKVMIAGGFDDFSEEGSNEFANMKATSNAETEFAMGREPTEMSRPTTSTRAGFMESQGTGVQVVMSAKTALEMGASIRAVVSYTATATDKQGRSIPAPGRGPISHAREISPSKTLPLLDIKYRARQLAFRRQQITQWLENERAVLKEEIALRRESGEEVEDGFVQERVAFIEEEAARQDKEALGTFGMLDGFDPRIAPLRRALAVWGLTADDIGVISIHGTSTTANDKNESNIYDDLFGHLSRTPGNCVPVIAQKYLTGHPKGGAAAWMLQGLIQSIESGIVPGNRNADNVDAVLRKFEYLMFPSKSIHTDGISAGLLTSFGFGQVGGLALILHPRYLFASLAPEQYKDYVDKNRIRAMSAYKAMSEMMITNSLVKIKDHPPYTEELETPVLLNPLARTERDALGGYSFTAKQLPKKAPIDAANAATLTAALSQVSDVSGVGVDHELISAVPSSNPMFVSRNFTEQEVSYCRSQPDPAASFAARWAGKEAVFKSLGVASKGAAASMKDIEIVSQATGAPLVVLHGDAKAAADAKGIKTVHLSLSHSETAALAFAQASSA